MIKLSYVHMNKCLNDNIFQQISDMSRERNQEVFVIGGFVRDCLLGKECKDIDVVVNGSGIEFARDLAKKLGKKKVHYFKNFGTAMFRHHNMELEFVGARKESYQKDSRKPIVENGSLEDDQKRRDFTINAMAFSLSPQNFGKLIDPFNGEKDLKNGIIRTPLDPNQTFSDDPLRMLRAIRFATQLKFTIEAESFEAIRNNKERIRIISKERITDELNKILQSDAPSKGFYLLEKSNLLAIIFPELDQLKGVESKEGKEHKDNFKHTLEVLDNLAKKSDHLWLRWAALLHDIAKPATKKFEPGTGWTFHGHEFLGMKMIPGIFRRMRLPLNEKMKFVQKMVRLHLRPIALVEESVSDSAIRRLLYEAGDDLEDLMKLCEADITSKNEHKVKRYLRNFKLVRQKMKEIEEKDSIRNFQPPIRGEEIINTFDIRPGPIVGEIKNSIKEAILEGEIPNNYEDARIFMMKKADELGLKKKE
ncbi:MAG: CCA tRNA nucleotidyltransferase [Bacteroidota bacterium]